MAERIAWRTNLFGTRAPGWSILVRLLVGLVVFFPEGIQKLAFPEILAAGRFANIGIPHPNLMGPFVGMIETICGALIILGLLTRLAAIPLIVIMIVAIVSTKVPILLGHDFWIFHVPKLPRYGFWSMAHEARDGLRHAAGVALSADRGRGRMVAGRAGAQNPQRASLHSGGLNDHESDRTFIAQIRRGGSRFGRVPHLARAADDPPTEPADYTLRIAPDLARTRTGQNDQNHGIQR